MKRRNTMVLLALAMCVALPLSAQDDPAQDKPAERPKAQAAAQEQAAPATGADPATGPAMSAEAQAMMAAWEKANSAGAQHKQLVDQFAGSWTTKSTMWMDPSAPPMSETGQSVATAFGDRHVREEYRSQMMGQPFQGMGLTSYDNTRGKYISSWTDTMSTGQFVSEGDYDPATKAYTFRGEMADPMKPGTMTPVRIVVNVKSNDEHTMEMHETRGGKEHKSMEIVYTRVK